MGPDRDDVRRRAVRLYGPLVAGDPAAWRVGDGAGAALAEPSPLSSARLLEDPAVDEFVAYGLHHDGSLRAAFARWGAAVERNTQISALPDPTLAFTQMIEDGRSAR